MNILFIGNSFTSRNDLEMIFESLCRENGKDVCTFRVTQGGRRMIQYTNDTDPITQQLKQLLQDRHYDAVFLQDQSLLPLLDFDAFQKGMQYVYELAKGHCDNIYLYATWARKSGNPDLLTYGWTPEYMTTALHDAYRKVAAKMGVAVSPVGCNFFKVVCAAADCDLYDQDLYHPSYYGSCLAALTHYHTIFGAFPGSTQSLSLQEDVVSAYKAAVCG